MIDTDWMSVPGLDGYEVSADGRVRSTTRTILRSDGTTAPVTGRVLKLRQSRKGYPWVSIRRKMRMVHVMVCEAFHGPRPSPTHQVRHLNGIKTDNRPENLAWGTPAENMADKKLHGTDYQANKTHCKNGHEFTPENTYHRSERPGRNCIKCQRERNRIWMRGYSQGRRVS